MEPRLLLAGDTYLINFQLAEAQVPTRYLADTGLVFGDRGGGLTYGWSTDHTTVSRDRGINPDQRLDTLIHFHQGQTWELALPDGLYEVTVSIGDAEFDSTHTLNVEDVNYWSAVPLLPGDFLLQTQQIMVSDGRLTLDQGSAGEMATRIDFIHVVGLPDGPNAAPATPTVTEPSVDGEVVHPSDVHMEAVGFSDADGNAHKSSDWEIWTVGPSPERVWQTLGITGVEKLHTHLGDGIFENSHAGRTDLISDFVPNFDFNTYTLVLPGVTAGDHLTIVAEMIDATGSAGLSLSGMVDAFSLFSPTSQNLVNDGSFELATNGTQTSNSNWVMTAQSDGVEPAATFQAAEWAASSGNTGVWFKGFRGTLGNPVDAEVSQVVTATISGDYTLQFDAKVEENFASVIGGFQVTITSDGTGGSQTIDLLNSFTPEYELRVRFRDDAGSVSDFATRQFQVAPASTVFPMELEDVLPVPAPTWTASAGGNVILPAAAPTAAQLRLESQSGELLLSIAGNDGVANLVTNPAALDGHAEARIVITAGSSGLTLAETDLAFRDDGGLDRTIYLPEVSLAPGQRLDLWVAIDGATYFGTAAQTQPDFSSLARSPGEVPFVALQPGFKVDVVATGLRLPVNIAFVPDPGPNPDDPLYYVTELYGSIQVVRRDGTRQTFATSLLDYNPNGPFGGTGEQGLTGLAVERDEDNPEIYHLYVGMLWDNGAPASSTFHYPKVERIDSAPGGLTMASRTVLLNMQPETQGQSHQISNITIGPDGKLYVHMGDGFDYTTAQNLDSFRGKVLRMNLDGSAPSDNPFYNADDGINARDYVFAYGLRNPFGGAWRAADGKHYEVENGPSVDRLARIDPGENYGWDNTNESMTLYAIYNWNPAHAPVNIEFVQPETFDGSQFPASMQDHVFVSESGPTYAPGPQTNGKRVVEFELDSTGNLVNGPTTLVEYSGAGRGTVVGLAAGPDGLYFTELYEDLGSNGPTAAGARIFRVRYVNPLAGDYDIDGDVDGDDHTVWANTFGSTYLLAADGNHNGIIDAGDYTVWRDNLGATLPTGGAALAPAAAVEARAAVSVNPEDITVALAEPSPAERAVAKIDRMTAFTSRSPAREFRIEPPARRTAIHSQPGNVRELALLAVLDRGLVRHVIEASGHEFARPSHRGQSAADDGADFAVAEELFAVYRPRISG